jgi:hypothetical protein
MLLKKLTLLGSAFALLSMPMIACADLTTLNYTDADSAVQITNNPIPALQFCSSNPFLGGKFTPHRSSPETPGKLTVGFDKVNLICGRSTGSCEADIFMSKGCDKGTLIAHAAMNLDNHTVTYVNPVNYTTYEAQKMEKDPSGILLCYKGQCPKS